MRLSLRKIMVAVVILIVLAFVILRFDELKQLVDTVQSASLWLLLAAVATQLCKYLAQSFAYSAAFRAVETRMRVSDTLPLVFGSFFMNTVAPSLNIAGMGLVVDDARRRGVPAARSTSAAILMQISIESGFAVIMLIGFAILAISGNLHPWWFSLGAIVILMVLAMISILVVGHKRPQLLLKILRPIEAFFMRMMLRFKRPAPKPWAENMAHSFGESAGLIAKNPRTASMVFLCSIIASTCELACFILVGMAFGIELPQAMICGYVIATLFAMISITPQGLGVVEAAVLVLFDAYGIHASAGMAATLVYRALVFWMPFLIGAVMIQVTKTFKRDRRDGAGEADGPGRLDEANGPNGPVTPVTSNAPDEPDELGAP